MITSLTTNQEALQRLTRIQAGAAPILSVYLNLGSSPTEVRTVGARLRDLLKPIQLLAESDQVDHAYAMSLRSAMTRVLDIGAALEDRLGHGWAIFVGDRLDLEEELTLPPYVWDCAVVGPRPYLRPLRAAIGRDSMVAAVTLDSRQSNILLSQGGRTLLRESIKTEVVRVANRGGWHGLDEHRSRQHADDVRHQLWCNTAARLAEMQREVAFEVLFLGGQTRSVNGLRDQLSPETRSIVGATFNLGVSTPTDSQILETVGLLLTEHQRQREQRVIAEIYAAYAMDDRAAVGLEQVIAASNRKAIAELVIQHGAMIGGRVCPQCEALSLYGPGCRECGAQTTTVVGDVLEGVARAVLDGGGTVEEMVSESALRDDLVAARLRFAIG